MIYYIEPLNAHTNEAIATGAFPDAVSQCRVKIGGREANVIEVSYATLRFIERSKL